jgi:hypothetical protein
VVLDTGETKFALARRRLLTFEELPGWGLYVIGTVVTVTAWPFARGAGVIMIVLGLIDHARGIRRAWRAAEQ